MTISIPTLYGYGDTNKYGVKYKGKDYPFMPDGGFTEPLPYELTSQFQDESYMPPQVSELDTLRAEREKLEAGMSPRTREILEERQKAKGDQGVPVDKGNFMQIAQKRAPWAFKDSHAEGRKIFIQKLPNLWKHTFRTMAYGSKLDAKSQKLWSENVERLKKESYNQANSRVATDQYRLKFMEKEFDRWAKEQGKDTTKVIGGRLVDYKGGKVKVLYEPPAKEEKKKATKFKKAISKETGKLTWHKIVEGKLIDTKMETPEVFKNKKKIETEIRKELRGKGKKDLKRTDYAALTSAYIKLMKSIEDGNETETHLRVKSVDMIRKSLGLEPMKIEKILGKDKFKILGIPIPLTGVPDSEAFVMDFGEKEKEATLPAGLTEEDIEYNMNKYNKTREEVINKFKGMK